MAVDLSGYTRQFIQKSMLAQVDSNIDTRQGSMVQTALGPAAWYLEGLYMTLAQVQENAYPSTAVGEGLDLIVQTRGIVRKQATPAIRQGKFNVEIPEGSRFKTINGANSLIYISGDLVSGDSENYVYQLTCTTPGSAGNQYAGPILPITSIPGLTSASIDGVVAAGTDEEEDGPLRARYFATFDTASFGGNIASYRNEILAMEGVGAVQVYPAWKGGGTALCSILGDDLMPALPATVEAVQQAICPLEEQDVPSSKGYGLAPIGAAVTITTATELTLNITCDIEFVSTLQNGEEIYQKEIEGKIQEYLDEVKAGWGSPLKSQTISYPITIYIARIIHAILQLPEIVNVTNVKINGSGEDLTLVETAQLQQVPVLGTVIINGE